MESISYLLTTAGAIGLALFGVLHNKHKKLGAYILYVSIALFSISVFLFWKSHSEQVSATNFENSETDQVLTPKNMIVIEQPRGKASAWFGDRHDGANVGQGQIFTIDQTATLRELHIYLTPTSGKQSDQIVCDIRDSHMSVLASTYIDGFSTIEGWQLFEFNVNLNPGKYAFTCHVMNSNRTENHHYSIGFDSSDNSYLNGYRLDAIGVAHQHIYNNKLWVKIGGDLKFKIVLEPNRK
ncbi:hypothetical protein KA005_44585 [bacterium]|nr:hypothetical protein [bacterium]